MLFIEYICAVVDKKDEDKIIFDDNERVYVKTMEMTVIVVSL